MMVTSFPGSACGPKYKTCQFSWTDGKQAAIGELDPSSLHCASDLVPTTEIGTAYGVYRQ